ncbi:ParA family protein [Piscirickettsia litoralis]|uniref:AAA domain-containing protein n=1 Tax=Piscirickettsia litoralis TaxID=1891921 RepID=A0ABX3A0Z3_9GAMM|nr:ParA family protein [Piscirickettsia litoralis]ODN41346.1 hypothetical protein BGC07_16375 [Piscirickettsia litoralis]
MPNKTLKIISTANQKGGVGKTNLNFNIGCMLAEKGKRVLFIDNDAQGNLTESLLGTKEDLTANTVDLYLNNNVEPTSIRKNIDLIGTNSNLAEIQTSDFEIVFALDHAIEPYKKKYDYIFIDCGPALGHSLLAALMASTHLLIPIEMDGYSASGMEELLQNVNVITSKPRYNPSLKIAGILINKKPSPQTKLSKQMESMMRELYGDLVFKQTISTSTSMKECAMPGIGLPITQYVAKHKKNDKAANKVVREMNCALKELNKRLGIDNKKVIRAKRTVKSRAKGAAA